MQKRMCLGSTDILSRPPAELADGLALKEFAPFLERKFAPTTWFPRSGQARIRRRVTVANRPGRPFFYDSFPMPTWNFSSNILALPPGENRGLVALARDGSRSEWTFGEVKEVSSRFAGGLRANGVSRGDVVLTFMGNTPEWVFTLTACWQIGAVAMPCNTQLTPHDLSKRIELIGPKLCVVDAPRAEAFPFEAVAGQSLGAADPAPAEPLEPDDP